MPALDKDVCLVGMGNKIEVWSKERWETNVNSIGDDIDSVRRTIWKRWVSLFNVKSVMFWRL